MEPSTHPKKAAHIAAIDAAIAELLALGKRTGAPASIQHQYIGTMVDNTMVLLTAPANSLDSGKRICRFTEMHNWISLMQAVHRSFLSSIQTATEKGLAEYCKANNADVCSRMKDNTEAQLKILEEHVNSTAEIARAIKKLRVSNRGMRPAFDDYLETAMGVAKLSKETKKTWRTFFRSLSILRNKVSHSDSLLDENERACLREGGFGKLISADNGQLSMNARMYKEIASYTLDFFDMLLSSKLQSGNGAS
jgi:hypothetical protein